MTTPAALQRIKSAQILLDGQVVGASKQGLLALVGIEDGDTETDVDAMVQRILQTTLWAEESDAKVSSSCLIGECGR